MTKFVGFTNDQMFKLAQMKGYTGKNNMNDINIGEFKISE